MNSSKLQSCIELCRFIEAFLKPGLQNRKRVPFRLARVFHSWLSSEQNGVLLEIRNQNKEGYLWSLVATTSLDLAVISLPRCQTMFDTSITMFVSSLFIMTQDDWCVQYSDQVHSLLSWFHKWLRMRPWSSFAEQWCQCWLHIEACFCLQDLIDNRHNPDPGIMKVIMPTFVSQRSKKWSP
jgi:hypothetical protein